ncbi:MAG: four helix bundle protein [Eubacterium sp.]
MDDYTLKLQKKTEIMLNTVVYPMLKNFPQAEKFALCQEIKQSYYRILRNCALYKTALNREKLAYLRRIDADIQYLKVLFNVARDQQYITKKKAYYLQTCLKELGAICGGLMKSARTS